MRKMSVTYDPQEMVIDVTELHAIDYTIFSKFHILSPAERELMYDV